jgi:AcrR family transcriptional regulator
VPSSSLERQGEPEAAVEPFWVERAVERSEQHQRTRAKAVEQAQQIVSAARRLIVVKGAQFTTQELVHEAGVALQTFYRSFESKDQLLLAVFEDLIGEACGLYQRQVRQIEDPVERIRSYVRAAVGAWRASPSHARFITEQHWRLFQLYPEEVATATAPFTRLIEEDLEAAAAAGLLHPSNPEQDAWFITQLVMAVFHHDAFAPRSESAVADEERLWAFCLAALGGSPS